MNDYIKISNVNSEGIAISLDMEITVWEEMLVAAQFFGWKKEGTGAQLNEILLTARQEKAEWLRSRHTEWRSEREEIEEFLALVKTHKDYFASDPLVEFEIVSAEDAGEFTNSLRLLRAFFESPLGGIFLSTADLLVSYAMS